jgi:hypothetical protein
MTYRVERVYCPFAPNPPPFRPIASTSMTTSSIMSSMIPQASLPLRALRNARRISQAALECHRAFHQSIRSNTLTPSRTPTRPLVRRSTARSFLQANAIAGSLRTIFIQTENTPNADVSIRTNATKTSC